MLSAAIIAFLVLLIVIAERISVAILTRTETRREWVRQHRFLHPNSISFVRMPMGLVSMTLWLYGLHAIAILWFAFWMISDLTDGTIARRCDLVTESGKWLDPLSDKLLYFPPLIIFAICGMLPSLWVTALVATDAFGQFSRLLTRKKAANSFGKAKTALITVLLSLTAINEISGGTLFSETFLAMVTASCAILAFLSVYCKIIPDSWYANSLTLANFLCGVAAIAVISQERFVLAFVLIFLGQFFDLFDGRMAVKFGSTRHGAIFDDIADGTSFGLAISYLIFATSGRDPIALIIAAVYLVCVIYRLIRFLKDQGNLPDGVFQGLPSPAGAMFAGSAALLFRDQPILPWLFVGLASLLMVSHVRYRHFSRKIWPELPNILKIVMFVIVLLFVNYRLASRTYLGTFELLCFSLAVSYTILGTDRVSDKLPTKRPR